MQLVEKHVISKTDPRFALIIVQHSLESPSIMLHSMRSDNTSSLLGSISPTSRWINSCKSMKLTGCFPARCLSRSQTSGQELDILL